MTTDASNSWKAKAAEVRRPARTPRPTFDGPNHIARRHASLHLWGDDVAGDVADWVYSSTDKIHHLVFGLAPGQSFRHSPEFRTVFGADELLYVLSGVMAIANPANGEVRRVSAGEAAVFGPGTWHHAYSMGAEALRVVEFFAPPPSRGTSSTYAKRQDYLETTSYADERWARSWPVSQDEARAAATIRHLIDGDLLWSMSGEGTMLGTYLSTDDLYVARMDQMPGARSGACCYAGDTAIHVLRGTVFLFILDMDDGRQRWFEATPGDGFFVPAGAHYELRNVTAEPSAMLMAVAPNAVDGDDGAA